MSVTTCSSLPANALENLFSSYQLQIEWVENTTTIPGSFWGETEAGLIKNTLYIQQQTPVHSALHEACHYICMDKTRRSGLDTDAGGGYDEENAVCYLQLLLSHYLPGYDQSQHFKDMDQWGYSFRLGSAKRWFNDDASDAKQWLIDKNLINTQSEPNWTLRLN